MKVKGIWVQEGQVVMVEQQPRDRQCKRRRQDDVACYAMQRGGLGSQSPAVLQRYEQRPSNATSGGPMTSAFVWGIDRWHRMVELTQARCDPRHRKLAPHTDDNRRKSHALAHRES